MVVSPSRIRLILLGVGVGLGTAHRADAVVLDFTSLTPGQRNVAAGPLTITAGPNGSVFDRKTALGVSGAGVSAPNSMVSGEIDSSESITVHAASPQRLNGFSVAMLFAAGVQGDAVNEMVFVDVIAGDTVSVTLALTANPSGGADLTGSSGGIVTAVSPGTQDGGGAFSVAGLGASFTDLVFRPGNGGSMAAAGDFSFVDLSYSDPALARQIVRVPEPRSFALLGIGLVGIGMMRRLSPREGSNASDPKR